MLKQREVDGTKLEQELKRRGLTLAEASREIGRSPAYLSKCKFEGQATASTLKVLEAVYNIAYDDIAPDRETPELIALPGRIETPEIMSRELADYLAVRIGEEVAKAINSSRRGSQIEFTDEDIRAAQ